MSEKITTERGLYLINKIANEELIVCFYDKTFSDYLLNNVKMNKKDILKNFEILKIKGIIQKMELNSCHISLYMENGFFLIQNY